MVIEDISINVVARIAKRVFILMTPCYQPIS